MAKTIRSKHDNRIDRLSYLKGIFDKMTKLVDGNLNLSILEREYLNDICIDIDRLISVYKDDK